MAGIAGQMSKLIRYLDMGMEDAVTTVRKLQAQGKNVGFFRHEFGHQSN